MIPLHIAFSKSQMYKLAKEYGQQNCCFLPDELSIGSLGNYQWEQRMASLSDLLDVDMSDYFTKEDYDRFCKAMEEKDITLWYSQNPSDLCGLYYVTWLLQDRPAHIEARCTDTGKTITLTDNLKRLYSDTWATLSEQNSGLRTLIDGRVHSVGTDYYDTFIAAHLGSVNPVADALHAIYEHYRYYISDDFLRTRLQKAMAES